ncbi:MAG: KGK family protein [Nostoc sp. LLA-1]|nr:KGK family protein [Cyanocohniella sp. LLY]
MNNKFISLDCDDDVLLIKEDSFKLSKLKDLARTYLRNMFTKIFHDSQGKYLRQNNIGDFQYIPFGETLIRSNEFRFSYLIDCQLLKIGSQGWQKGTLKMQVFISPFKQEPDKVLIEFSPDQVDELESPLDDIRKLIQAEK